MVRPGAARSRLPGLEALRAVAALCILLLHTRAVFGGTPVFGKGYLAVEFFLMLSGFLMARSQEPRMAQAPAPWRFLRQRYARLWPMMALGGLIGLPRLFAITPDAAQAVMTAALNLALLPVWFGRFAFALNIPAWTILAELVANALHVFVLRHLRGVSLAALVGLLAATMAWIGQAWGSFDVGARVDDMAAGLPRILLAYVIGIALGRQWRDGPSTPVPAWLALPAMPALLAGQWWLGWNHWSFDFLFTLVACPLVIAGGLRLDRWHCVAARLGQLSFPLFALQMPILEGGRMLGLSGWQSALAAVIAAACAGFLPGRPRRATAKNTSM